MAPSRPSQSKNYVNSYFPLRSRVSQAVEELPGRTSCSIWPLTGTTHSSSVCVISIVRLIILQSFHHPEQHYDSNPILLWSAAEAATAIVIACVPIMRPLLPSSSMRVNSSSLRLASSRKTPSEDSKPQVSSEADLNASEPGPARLDEEMTLEHNEVVRMNEISLGAYEPHDHRNG